MMHWKYLLAGVFIAAQSSRVVAVPVASDSSSSLTYNAETGGAWKGLQPSATENPAGTDNGGYGFQPWIFAGGFHNETASPYGRLNHFIDGVDFPHSTFNNLGSRAFGLTNANVASFGYTSRATRVFSQPLAVGGTATIDFDNPVLAPLQNNDETGYIVRLNSGGGPKIGSFPNVRERLGLFATDGFNQDRWNRTDASGVTDTGLPTNSTTSGARFRVTLQTAESYLLEILPLSGGAPLYTATGNLANPGSGSIDSIEILMFGNGSGNGLTGATGKTTGQREFFFDRLVVDNPLTSLAGDFNRDGAVDAADYIVWRKMLNTTVSHGSGADADGNGMVTISDYNFWWNSFHTSSNSATRVPEPSHSLVMVIMLLAAGHYRRHKR
jgi:hypothetical protein